ncbi:MAG: hypothetical protein A2138_10695 [Deltaproteobacteria bacterium RBG_16_71_12]|nr:MAG: hypothetical protein A2138_10695 [Deltaproteobacteria bacterium RBG_16_71_12]
MNIAELLARIPYLEPHRLEVTPGRAQVHMPGREQLMNHVGIVHAGALYTAAETAAGIAAMDVVGDQRAVVLLRSANVRYTRRATGPVLATATVDLGRAQAARQAFLAVARADVTVTVVADCEGEPVLEGTFDYALRPRRET